MLPEYNYCVGQSSLQNMTRPTIQPLTSVRFFAALYVVMYHTLTELVRGKDDPTAVNGDFLGLGYISVSFFFVLSGFILARVYLEKDQGFSFRQFWVARFARVYPLFLLTLVLDTPHWFLSGVRRVGFHAAITSTFEVFVANLALLQAWIVSLRGIDNPNWSLSVEAFFYILFPFISIPLRRLKSGSLYWGMAFCYIIGMVLIHFAGGLPVPIDAIKFSPILHLHEFVEGICAALITMRLKNRGDKSLKSLSVYLLWGSALAFATFVFFSPHLLNLHLLIHDGMLSPLFLTVIISLAYGSTILHSMLSNRYLLLLGESSYGLYLIHIPVWHIAKHLPSGHSFATYPLYLATAIGLSVACFCYFERPSRRFILKIFQARSVETLVNSSAMQ
jgi:peptidoglycan/LPS O-acetylase OafA/YrhL